jgi:hypothetical protein
MGDDVGGRYQPQLVLRLAQFSARDGSAVCVRLRKSPEQCAGPQARRISKPKKPVAFVASKADLWGTVGNRLRRWRERPPVGRAVNDRFRSRARRGFGQGM